MPSCLYTKVYCLLLSLAFPLIGFGQTLSLFKFERPLMGTHFFIVCYANDSTLAAQTAEKAFSRIEMLNNILSDYHPESEINLLTNNQVVGEAYKVSDDLWYMLQKSTQVAKLTNGIFDVTIGSCTKLWRRAKRKRELPQNKEIDNALENTGISTFELLPTKQSIVFNRPDVKLDFGGIAKGYAADEAFRIFKSAGIEQVMVDAGGDIFCGKAPPNKKAWQVKIISGLGTDTLQANLENAAIATSGDLYRFFELEGKRYSHIINPKTCMPISEAMATTVISGSAEQADYLASVANILGKGTTTKKISKKHAESYIIVAVKKSKKTTVKYYGNKKFKSLLKQ